MSKSKLLHVKRISKRAENENPESLLELRILSDEEQDIRPQEHLIRRLKNERQWDKTILQKKTVTGVIALDYLKTMLGRGGKLSNYNGRLRLSQGEISAFVS